ncbi:MAG: TRAP transporter substrate-binding protein [Geminicoccaceae bacterium]
MGGILAMRRLTCSAVVLAVVGGTAWGGAAPARAQEITLKLHHFLGPTAPAQRDFFEPWAKRVEEQSNGRIKIQIYPSMTLGGSPPQLISQLRDGVVDIIWTLPSYTAGQFPRTEVFELPFVHTNDAVATNLAIEDLYDEWLAQEYQDIHPILLHVHAGNALHTIDKPVRTPEDLRGLKIRTPSRTGSFMLEALGANPVGMPVPQLPQALSKHVVDGTTIPYEVSLPLKIHELVKYHMEFEDGTRLGTSVFLFGMNKARYESLPDDLKAVIDQNSGANIAAEIGKVWMDAEEPGRQAAIEAGNEFIDWPNADKPKWQAAVQPAIDRWLAEMQDAGIDGQALLAAARAAVEAHSDH